MRIIQVNPILVKSFADDYPQAFDNRILAGKSCVPMGISTNYRGELIFAGGLFKANEYVKKAVLEMFSTNCSPCQTDIKVCIGDDYQAVAVSGGGLYQWDITDILRADTGSPIKMVVRGEGCPNSLREFEALAFGLKPKLIVFAEEIITQGGQKVVNIKKKYYGVNADRHSDWIECISLDNYCYYIENCGTRDIQVYLEISPDKALNVIDCGKRIIKPDETCCLTPIRPSKYIRLIFSSPQPGKPVLFKTFFQGTEKK